MRPRHVAARERTENGAVAIMVAILVSAVLLAMAAVGVDTARWLVERERLQAAADAAALAGVIYMPHDFANAEMQARRSAARNGYQNGADTDGDGLPDIVVQVEEGDEPTQLRVTIQSTVHNQFGAAINVSTATPSRTAVADFTGPAPMGSPCNTFGNQPPSQAHALPTGFAGAPVTHATCAALPNFWAAAEGPTTDKVEGDRFSTINCAGAATYECAGGRNKEYRPDGYFFAIKVQPSAVGRQMEVQVYDPSYVHTGITCSSLPATGSIASNDLNDYAKTDAKTRYANTASTTSARQYCSGDYNPGASGAATTPPTTSFAVREQTDTNDPTKAPVVAGCTKQYAPVRSYSINNLTRTNSAYAPEFARVFHQWVPLCRFTPTRQGDYYLQVRTNVPLGGTPTPGSKPGSFVAEYRDNSAVTAKGVSTTPATGTGLNSFALRAVNPSSTAPLAGVSVSGYARMPILQNVEGSTATFNLIRAMPATRGQSINFDFFDPADGAGSKAASVRVIRPPDATGSIRTGSNIANCRGRKNGTGGYTPLTNCTATVTGTGFNGQLQAMSIPLPNDYNCDSTNPGGCWFTVEVKFPSDSDVTDFTTWTANVGGDPVRLIE